MNLAECQLPILEDLITDVHVPNSPNKRHITQLVLPKSKSLDVERGMNATKNDNSHSKDPQKGNICSSHLLIHVILFMFYASNTAGLILCWIYLPQLRSLSIYLGSLLGQCVLFHVIFLFFNHVLSRWASEYAVLIGPYVFNLLYVMTMLLVIKLEVSLTHSFPSRSMRLSSWTVGLLFALLIPAERHLIWRIRIGYQERILNNQGLDDKDKIKSMECQDRLLKMLDWILITLVVMMTGVLGFILSPHSAIYGNSSVLLIATPLLTLTSSLLVIGDTLKMMLNAFLFLLSTHPFDLGDRIYLEGSGQGSSLFVEQIGLLSTRMRRFDGLVMIIPNYVLSGKVIVNARRAMATNAKGQAQHLDLILDSSISNKQLKQIHYKINELTRNNLDEDFDSIISATWSFRQSNDLHLALMIRHKASFQNGHQKSQRQNKILEHVRQVLKECLCDGKSGHVEYVPINHNIRLIK